MTGVLYRLARFSVRHRFAVLAAWILVAVALVGVSHHLGDNTNDSVTLPGTNSQQATDALSKSFPDQANGSSPIVLHVASGKLTDAKYSQAVGQAAADVAKAPDVASVVNPLTTQGASALSKDQRTGYLAVTLSVSPGALSVGDAQTIINAAARPAQAAGIQVQTGGQLGLKVSKPATEDSELIGILAAMVILTFTFGTVVAMLLPIVTAILGLAATLSIIQIVSHATTVSTVAPTLATMIGLGVGIDYALFIVTRHFRGLRDGLAVRESIARAAATSGGAVAFAGATVTIALVSLAVAGIPLVTTMGLMAAVAVVVAVAAALTLLPAVLAIVGPRINALRVRGRHPADHNRRGAWARWASGVTRRPVVSTLAALAILVPLAVPVLSLTLGQKDVAALSTSTTARQAYDQITDNFGPGVNGPLLIAVTLGTPAQASSSSSSNGSASSQGTASGSASSQGSASGSASSQGSASGSASSQGSASGSAGSQGSASGSAGSQSSAGSQGSAGGDPRASDPRLQTLEKGVSQTAGVAAVTPVQINQAGTTAFFNAVATTGPAEQATANLVSTLRSTVIPAAEKGTNMRAYVGGSTAANADLATKIASKLLLQILVVIALSFGLLLLAFRSVVIPAQAAIMNLLSIGAAYGILVATFQFGWGHALIGLNGPVPVVSYVPLFMFAVLFGLSMDYEVFLVSQIKEHADAGEDPRRSVVSGLVTSGRVITAAATIMVFVFGSFVLNGDPTVKQFGIGLAAAVILDATIVRCLLVPARMARLGRANWYLPSWLGRLLPRINIEGEQYFTTPGQAPPATQHPAPQASTTAP